MRQNENVKNSRRGNGKRKKLRMHKINVAVKQFDSNNVYSNSVCSMIGVRNGSIVLDIRDSKNVLIQELPRLYGKTEYKEACILYDRERIHRIIEIQKPTNPVKRLFWRWGFRNKDYIADRNHIVNLSKTHPGSQLIYASKHVEFYGKLLHLPERDRVAAFLIYVDWKNVTQKELIDAEIALNKSDMEAFEEVKYKFN